MKCRTPTLRVVTTVLVQALFYYIKNKKIRGKKSMSSIATFLVNFEKFDALAKSPNINYHGTKKRSTTVAGAVITSIGSLLLLIYLIN